nr:MFS transporter [Gordonia soli]
MIPLYPLYAVLFADPVAGGGLSPAAISSLFVIWSLTSVLAEIPSGLLADRYSRRALLTVGPLLVGSGFVLWVGWPCYPVFATGFVLWAVGGSLRSGAIQALVYDELDLHGRAARFPAVWGRVRAMQAAGMLIGTAVAAPLFAVGGYPAVGIASGAACVLCASASACLPETRRSGTRRSGARRSGARRSVGTGDGLTSDVDDGETQQLSDHAQPMGWRAVGADALRQVQAHAAVRAALILVIALTGVAALDEYLPLLADEMVTGGTSSATGHGAAVGIPLLMLVIAIGDMIGNLCAGRSADRGAVSRRRLGRCLTVGSLALLAGALIDHPIGIVGVAVGFGVFSWSLVVAESALQDRVSSASRATVTSVAGVGEEAVAILAFALWAGGSAVAGPAVLFAIAVVPYVLWGAAMWASVARSRSGSTTRCQSGGATTSRTAARWPKIISRRSPM